MIIEERRLDEYENEKEYRDFRCELQRVSDRVGFSASFSMITNIFLDGMRKVKYLADPAGFNRLADRMIKEIEVIRRGDFDD